MKGVTVVVGCGLLAVGLSSFAVETPQKIEVPSTAKYEHSFFKANDQAFKVAIQKWSGDKGDYGVISVVSAETIGGCVLKKKFTSLPLFVEKESDLVLGTAVQNSEKSRLTLRLPLSVDHYISEGYLDDIDGEVSRSLHCDGRDHFAVVQSDHL